MNWLKKNKDWLITLAVFAFFALILLLYNIFFRGTAQEQTSSPPEQNLTYELPAGEGASAGEDQQQGRPSATTSFFLRPRPAELFEKLENLSRLEFKQQTRDLPGLKVMWPAYFFSVRSVKNQQAEVLLDASPDGFGVTLVTSIDTSRYPEILALERGKKIWLAAEITGVDPRGTGQFHLETEYVRFDDYQPPVPARAEVEKE